MSQVQEVSAFFFLPTAAAYLIACGGWFAVTRFGSGWWPDEEWPTTERRWLDLGLVVVTVVGIMALGQLYREGLLLPHPGDGFLGALAWNANNVIIFAPLFLVLAARRQHPRTAFLSPRGLGKKLALGLGLGVLSVLVFVGLRGELARLPGILVTTVGLDSLRNFFPVFMEGAAVAFVFVRLKWAIGLWPAILLPSLVFALAHVPGSLEAGRSLGYIASFFFFTGGLTSAILYTVQRSRDVVWIGLVHYLMDVAIEAF